MHRKDILSTASSLTTGERNKSYGEPYNNLSDIARLVSAYLNTRGIPCALDAEDIAHICVLQKMARSCNRSGVHNDNYIDMAAYSAIAGECADIGLAEREEV